MEILKRTSQGRGEYEIAGSVNGIQKSSLLNVPLYIKTNSAFGTLPTGIHLLNQGNKPRLRRIGNSGIQIQRQIEALLIMPKSIREERLLPGGQPILIAERYLLRRIDIQDVELKPPTNPSAATLSIGDIDCTNDSGSHAIHFDARVKDIFKLYDRAAELPPAVASALLAHRDSILSTQRITTDTEKLVENIIKATESSVGDSDIVLISGEDPVPLLLDLLKIQPSVEIPLIDEIDPQDIEIRRRVADRWRLQKDRGASSTKFRKDVRHAYRCTCLFCGLTLPASEGIRIPGVDAAHIVPWAQYEADIVGNGLCLCKLHHWAFDQYLLALIHKPASGYEIVVTSIAEQAFSDNPLVLESLRKIAGPVEQNRLPSDPAHWPRPDLLKKLYEDVRVDL